MMKQLAIILLLAALASPAATQDYEITHWTIASGGTMTAETTDGEWQLTGGFWADLLEELGDILFRDGFEQ